jgi:hypothetical protein
MSTLTGRTIRSTYDQLIQLEDNLIQDGFGTHSLNGSYNLTGSQFISGNLYINGTASIDYIVSSYESSSIIYSSGSTKFGDDTSDTHEFTGSVTISGSLFSDNLSGSFSGSYFGLVDSASNAARSISASQADNATTASHALTSSKLNTINEESTAAQQNVLFAENLSGTNEVRTDVAFRYLPNTETLTVTRVLGYLEGTASFAETASVVLGSIESASFAETASLALSTSVTVEVTTSFAQSGDGPFTGSFSSSFYSFLSGSFTGSSLGTFTGSLFGTASIADNSTSASHANSSISSSFAESGDGVFSGSFSGSFEGDGTNLTGVASPTGSYTGSFTGSMLVDDGSGSFSGSFEGDGTNLTGIDTFTVTNSSNNRVITSITSTSGNAEQNLTFDGTTLTIGGNINTGQGITEVYLMNQNVRTSDAVSFASITETSAQRYKENIQTLESGDSILKLRPVTFDWKESGEKDYGLIAEEVNDHLPELVKKNEEGEVEGIKYSKLTSLLVKIVQEQQIEISNLKNRLDSLDI